MKNVLIVLSVLLALFSNAWAGDDALNEKQKLGYALGMDIGASLKRMNPPIDLDLLLEGIDDFYQGAKDLLLSPDEAYHIKKKYADTHSKNSVEKKRDNKQDLLKWRMAAEKKNEFIANRFFEANRHAYGVQETESGLQYMVIHKGGGKVPSIDDIVSLQYKAMSIDGVVFDSSYKRKTPTLLPVRKALKAWQEVLLMMNVGSSYRVYVPAKLSYGKIGSGTFVEPGAALIFEIELLGVVDPEIYQQSEAKRHKIPPYTSLGQYEIILDKEKLKQSVVDSSDVDLQTLESAANTFMRLRNNIMPVYRIENIQEICRIVSDNKFMPECVNILMERVNWLKSLNGLKGADFPEGIIKPAKGLENAIDIQWKEVLFFDDNTSRSNTYLLRVFFNNVKDQWRISNIVKKMRQAELENSIN